MDGCRQDPELIVEEKDDCDGEESYNTELACRAHL